MYICDRETERGRETERVIEIENERKKYSVSV